jgi:GPH family glycoside/pentoside/hexuronide:cation symporter
VLSARERLAYAAGVAGFNLAEQLVVVLLLYFYLPPAGRGLVAIVPERAFFGPITAFGAAMLLGRIVDSLADPIVGYWSDRSRSRRGRRRVFLIGAVVPLSLLPALALFPPAEPGSSANAWFLAALLCGFFGAFAAYVAPLLALLPELGVDPATRARLARGAGAAGLVTSLGFAPVAFGAARALETGLGLDPAVSLRGVGIGGAVLAGALCALPIAVLRERSVGVGAMSSLRFSQAVATTLRDVPFLIYVAAQVLLMLAVGLVAPLLPYLAVAILGRSESFVAVLALPLITGTGLGLALLPRSLEGLGPKRSLVAGALLAVPCLAVWSRLGPDQVAIALASLALLGIGIAAFAAIPFLLIGQVIDADARRRGTSRAALYFGMQGLALKWVRGIGGALLAWLFAGWGNSAARPGGIQLAGAIAAGCMLAAAGLLALYPERDVLERGRATDPDAEKPCSRSRP